MYVYVVLCKYDGCDDCSPGAHIVSVHTTERKANDSEEKHNKRGSRFERAHYHYFYTEVVKITLEGG